MDVRPTKQAIQKAREALARQRWNETKLLEVAKSKGYTLGSQQRTKFFNRQPVARSTADKIGLLLNLTWKDGEDLEPVSRKQREKNSSDIDALVREVRSRCCEAILENYSKIRLPDYTRIDVDLLYVDVYVLEKLSSKRYASISGLLEGVEQREDYERLALGQR